MNNDIFILSDDDKYLVIGWPTYNGVSNHIIIGMTDNFVYKKITETKDCYIKIAKNKLKNYLNIKVDYVLEDKNLKKQIILESTNKLDLTYKEYTNIDIKCIESYNGLSLSFISETLFDKYYLYEKINNNYIFINESEDFQVTSDDFKTDGIYYVEGYIKDPDNNSYELAGKSKDCKCNIKNIKTTKKPKLSIVVPVYNAQYFVSRTIDTILFSTLDNFEIILVDDGSTDDSPKILDWYAKKYKNLFKVFHKKNEGVARARMDGLNLASGEYVAFCDSDDLVHQYMYEKLYNAAVKEKSLISIGKTYEITDYYTKKIILNVNSDDDYIVYDYENMLNNVFFVSSCNRIIKTDFLKKYKIPSLDYYEDIGYTVMIYSYIDKFVFVPSAYYFWDRRLRKTIGTITDYGYFNTNDNRKLHEQYVYSIYYGFYNGNKDKIDILEYSAVKDAYNFMKHHNMQDLNTDISLIYKSSIIEANKLYP